MITESAPSVQRPVSGSPRILHIHARRTAQPASDTVYLAEAIRYGGFHQRHVVRMRVVDEIALYIASNSRHGKTSFNQQPCRKEEWKVVEHRLYDGWFTVYRTEKDLPCPSYRHLSCPNSEHVSEFEHEKTQENQPKYFIRLSVWKLTIYKQTFSFLS